MRALLRRRSTASHWDSPCEVQASLTFARLAAAQWVIVGSVPCLCKPGGVLNNAGRGCSAFPPLAKPSDESSLRRISLLPLRSVISLLVRSDSRSQMHSPCHILAGDLQFGTGPDCNHFANLRCWGWGQRLGLRVTPVWPLLVDFGGSLDAVSANRHCDWLDTAGWMLRCRDERVRRCSSGLPASSHGLLCTLFASLSTPVMQNRPVC